jgi:Phage integrase family
VVARGLGAGWRKFKMLIAGAGVREMRCHDLRHTNASRALGAGLSMTTVSESLVHNSTTITADLYTHVAPIVARDAAQRIPASIPGPTRRSQPQDTPRYVNGMSNETTGASLEAGQ